MRDYIIAGLLATLIGLSFMYKAERSENKQLHTTINGMVIQLQVEKDTNANMKKTYEEKFRIVEESKKAEESTREAFNSVEESIRQLDVVKCNNQPSTNSDIEQDHIMGSLKLMQEAACIANSCVK